jgi:signal transduction histidine kinase
MLKRIKVRGKLLLLLATPLVAVMVFAYSGIVDRTEQTSFQEEEARLAELANAGSDLTLAIQVERLGVLEVERMMMDEGTVLTEERDATNFHLHHWMGAARAALPDLEDPALIGAVEDLLERLPTTLSPDRGTDVVTGTLLGSAGRAVDDITRSLAAEASDLELFRALTDLNALLNIQSSYATITSVGSEAIFQNQLSAVAATLITQAERTAQNNIASFNETADQQYVEDLLRLQTTGILPSPAGGTVDALTEVRQFISNADQGGVEAWLVRGEEQLTALNDLIDTVISDATELAQTQATRANEEAQSFLILAGSVVLLALIMAIFIGRSISRPLSRLTRSAEQLSTEELPALVESMRSSGRAEAPVLTPIEAKGRDEVAQLAHAISEIQQVTIDVAEEQGDLLRRGISDIFVNLARRNQSLLDRQIDFIDQLESREENPDQLENLFRLDHLATRMRRNAESLLVLAGAEPTRRRGRPVEIVDVLRVAMGEIEDFSRIELMSVDPSTVAGSVAVDLAHLMSELMENATQFSPPDSPVEVVGYRIDDDSYQLTLADRGIGMSAEQIATANRTLAEPPLVGLDLSRSLGFTVVSRLAHRLGVVVQLTSGSDGGVTAVITIPAEMVGAPEEHATPAEPLLADLEAEPSSSDPTPALPSIPAPPIADATMANPFGDVTPTLGPAPHHDAPPMVPEPARAEADGGLAKLPTRRPKPPAATPTEPPAAPAPATEPAAADGDLFAAFGTPSTLPAPPTDTETDLFAPLDGGPPLPTREPTRVETPSDVPPVSVPEPPSTPIATPPPTAPPTRDPAAVGAVSSQVTSAGLIRRTPKQIDVPAESKFTAASTPSPPSVESAAPTANRSPEEVRQMLSRYRAGLRKGRTPDSDTDQPKRRS